MKTNSDPMYNKFKDEDFANAKSVAEIPALAKLQEENTGKSRITMRVDNDILSVFKARAKQAGGSYQTMMNEALRQSIQGETLVDVVRQTIRQELDHGHRK